MTVISRRQNDSKDINGLRRCTLLQNSNSYNQQQLFIIAMPAIIKSSPKAKNQKPEGRRITTITPIPRIMAAIPIFLQFRLKI